MRALKVAGKVSEGAGRASEGAGRGSGGVVYTSSIIIPYGADNQKGKKEQRN